VLERLQQQAKKQNRSVEAFVQEELERAVSFSSPEPAEATSFAQAVRRLRSLPADERVPDVNPVDIEGIPASELLIRDRRRR
jgi:hypothetical protein